MSLTSKHIPVSFSLPSSLTVWFLCTIFIAESFSLSLFFFLILNFIFIPALTCKPFYFPLSHRESLGGNTEDSCTFYGLLLKHYCLCFFRLHLFLYTEKCCCAVCRLNKPAGSHTRDGPVFMLHDLFLVQSENSVHERSSTSLSGNVQPRSSVPLHRGLCTQQFARFQQWMRLCGPSSFGSLPSGNLSSWTWRNRHGWKSGDHTGVFIWSRLWAITLLPVCLGACWLSSRCPSHRLPSVKLNLPSKL